VPAKNGGSVSLVTYGSPLAPSPVSSGLFSRDSLAGASQFLGRYLRPQWRRVALLGALLLTVTVLQLLSPQVVRFFIDTAREGGALQTLFLAGALFLAASLVSQAANVAETYLAAAVGWSATNALRADLTAHCLTLDPAFHETHTPGELIERIDGDCNTLLTFFSRLMLLVFGNSLLLVGALLLLAREDWRFGVLLAFSSAVTLTLIAWRRAHVLPYVMATRQTSADLYGFLEERLGGLTDIHGNGLQPHVMDRLLMRLRSVFQASRRRLLKEITTGLPGSVVAMASMAGTLALAASLYRAGDVTLGTVYLVVQYAALVRQPMRQISRQLEEFQQAGVSLTRIRSLFDTPSTIQDGLARQLPIGPLAVRFADVSFTYGTHATPALMDVSLDLAPGEILGVLGRTGSGKSTLARLLFRLYDPQAGSVTVGGVDVRHLQRDALRSRIGLVTQEVQLLGETVRDHVTLFDRSVPDERIHTVLDDLGLASWQRALSRGLDTPLRGSDGLSAGEAQLLAFARVFLRDPALVILDEASSRLDPATEQLVERAVDRLLAGRTALVIAHRLSTVARADHIAVLEGGRIVEHGMRTALQADPESHFARLLRAGLTDLDEAAPRGSEPPYPPEIARVAAGTPTWEVRA
jgi:ATP-binding cassette, subfamily B, bacterial